MTMLLAESTAAGSHITIDLFFVLGAAAIVAIVLQRVRLASVPAFFLAGALIGPNALGLVTYAGFIDNVTHYAVLLLLFGIGLHLDIHVFRKEFISMLVAGLGSCVLSVAFGWIIVLIWGLSAIEGLVIAMAFSLSSTAVVLRLLNERRELRHPHGRLSLSILIIQDLVVIAMVALLPLLATISSSTNGGSPSTEAGVAISGTGFEMRDVALVLLRLIGVSAMIFVGFLVLPKIVHEAARTKSLDVLAILGLAVALGAGLLTQWLGFSTELGAFLGGFILSTTPFRYQLSGLLSGLRDIFMAVFFVAIGMKINVSLVIESWFLILLAGLVLVIAKTIIIGGCCWAVGAGVSTALTVGLSLGQAGEFSLILIERAAGLQLLSETLASRLLSIVVLSLMFTPAMVAAARRLRTLTEPISWSAPWIRRLSRLPEPHGPTTRTSSSDAALTHVPPTPRRAIIAGFGTVGRQVLAALESSGVVCTVVELNPYTVRALAESGKPVAFGNISDPEVLESLDLDSALILVLTIPDDSTAVRACAIAKSKHPAVRVAVRLHFPSSAPKARQAGADLIVVDEEATAQQMIGALMSQVSPGEPNAAKASGGHSTV